MTPIGDRIFFEVSEQTLFFRIKNGIGAVVITMACAFLFCFILGYVWVFALAFLYGAIDYLGYSDYLFDQSSGFFRKRYGIGRFTLGDSICIPLEEVQIQAKITSSYIGDFPVYDVYMIQIIKDKQKIEFYTSPNLKLIQVLFEHLKFSGAKTVEWQIDEGTTA